MSLSTLHPFLEDTYPSVKPALFFDWQQRKLKTPLVKIRDKVNRIQPLEEMSDLDKLVKRLVHRYGAENIVIAYDLDHTVMLKEARILRDGNEELLEEMLAHVKAENSDFDPRHYREAWTKSVLTDDHIPDQLDAFRQLGVNTLGLTARKGTDRVQAITSHQLEDLNVQLGSGVFASQPTLEMNESTHFNDGVLFTGRKDKGDALAQYLEHIDYQPKVVLFIDNKRNRVEEVATMCKSSAIDFYGFHYSGYLKHDNTIDEDIVAMQAQYLIEHDMWLSDKEASLRLNMQASSRIKMK